MITTMFHRIFPMSLCILSLSVAAQASALPPDPGNICGGSGWCQSEAEEAEYWQQFCYGAYDAEDDALQDLNYCEIACESNCSIECAPEQAAYEAAHAAAGYACSQRDAAEAQLNICISQGCH